MSKLGDEPAFPVTPRNAGGQTADTFCGLTKREHYAGLAMQGLLASTQYPVDGENGKITFEAYARCAVHHADALIAELEKRWHHEE